MSQKTVGEALVAGLKARGVTCVFGIPGVHTVELYRGLASSGIRHVTPRHEQGAGFMADGYARVSGKPGVAFVITGPGLTNTLTPMAQARADSVPMLVVSSVNAGHTLGKGHGHLHELPDQHGLARSVALTSEHVAAPDQLTTALENAFAPFASARPGPTHIEIPLDVAGVAYAGLPEPASSTSLPRNPSAIEEAAERLIAAQRIVILAGGGAKTCGPALRQLAERLDAPVVQTVNARGAMHDHPLGVPASPSLNAIRALIGEADCVLALGTELGPTDYDMYATGEMAPMSGLIRVDICAEQLNRHSAALAIRDTADRFLDDLLATLPEVHATRNGATRAAQARDKALEQIGADYRAQVAILDAMRDACPGALMVGDSTQPIYAGNLYYDHDRPGGWFNAATGYGALGYGIPAAIGAAIATPEATVICITGDGGAQFSLPEIMVAAQENLPVLFVVWNNSGYREIATSMEDVGVEVIGCDPAPPDFAAIAQACDIPHTRVDMEPSTVADALKEAAAQRRPAMIEITAP